jgi:hypothetical protein
MNAGNVNPGEQALRALFLIKIAALGLLVR